MKGWIKWVTATLALSAVTHLGVVVAIPRVLMLVVKHKAGGGLNRIHHGEPVTAASREVVRPSPDLLYSLCPYDLSRGPLRITASVPDTYFSISAFAANTDNFFVVNDTQVKGKKIDLVLVARGSGYKPTAAERVVTSPTKAGLVLFRTLIRDGRQLAGLRQIQRRADCRPLGEHRR